VLPEEMEVWKIFKTIEDLCSVPILSVNTQTFFNSKIVDSTSSSKMTRALESHQPVTCDVVA
jgi:hypothetical protein